MTALFGNEMAQVFTTALCVSLLILIGLSPLLIKKHNDQKGGDE